MTILSKRFYNEYIDGVSIFSGEQVCILGEQTTLTEDGRVVEQYLYNIKGLGTKNGRPFVSLKANIVIL